MTYFKTQVYYLMLYSYMFRIKQVSHSLPYSSNNLDEFIFDNIHIHIFIFFKNMKMGVEKSVLISHPICFTKGLII
jgi:hypothetical protein